MPDAEGTPTWQEMYEQAVRRVTELRAEGERLRAERDSQQRLCIREMEKVERLRNALMDARSYFDRVPRSLGYWIDVVPDIDRAIRETGPSPITSQSHD